MWSCQWVIVALIFCGLFGETSARGGDIFRQSGPFAYRFPDPDSENLDPGMTKDLRIMQRAGKWELSPCDLSNVEDKTLRRHIKKVLSNKPIGIVLESKGLKLGGFRAVAMTSEGKKVRAQYEKRVVDTRTCLPDSQVNDARYEDAMVDWSQANVVDIQLRLPPIPGTKVMPTVMYSVPMGLGTLNRSAAITTGRGKVTIYPNGKENTKTDNAIEAGRASMHLPMGSGLVDPGWAKGRPFFRKGRPVGEV